MEILTCEDVTIGYEGNALAKGISFGVRAGDYLCIIGENGAGKSTLMKAMLGLHPLISGRIRLHAGVRRSDVGYLSQQTAAQKDFPASVREIVLSGCISRLRTPFFGGKERQAAAGAMERLGITDLKNRCFRELSGGQQQRVLLARALCAARKLMFLDEPVSGLDPLVTRQMYDVVYEENKKGMTVVMISHDIDATLRFASHILYMGDKVLFGTKEEFMKSAPGRRLLSERSVKSDASGD